jgi:hypothetical protein
LGPKDLRVLKVPDVEVFGPTGENKDKTEWRNPAGKWLRQIIQTDCQLIHFVEDFHIRKPHVIGKMFWRNNKNQITLVVKVQRTLSGPVVRGQ